MNSNDSFLNSCNTIIDLVFYRLIVILEYLFWTVCCLWCLFKLSLNGSCWTHLIQWIKRTEYGMKCIEIRTSKHGKCLMMKGWIENYMQYCQMEFVGRERCWCTGIKKEKGSRCVNSIFWIQDEILLGIGSWLVYFQTCVIVWFFFVEKCLNSTSVEKVCRLLLVWPLM